jgi:tartrate-resistant acid phosphatase type 5
LNLVHEDNELSFFVIGDWGGLPNSPYRTVIETQVSKTMNELSQTHNTKFQVALGDNFYFNGVQNVGDTRFKVNKNFFV